MEPPVPPGLSELTASLHSFADFLRVDDDLLAVAATAGRGQVSASGLPAEGDLPGQVERLPASEKDAVLVRLVRGEVAHLRAELLRRYRAESAEAAESAGGGGGGTSAGGRTVAELLAASEAHYAERERLAEQRHAQERDRRERAAAAARAEHLDALALREEQAWEQVDTLIDTKRPRDYDTATTLLADLRSVGERKGRLDTFDRRFQLLCGRHARNPSLLQRLERAGLLVAAE